MIPLEQRLQDDEAFKACCAELYSGDLVALLLGPSYHPGGRELTRRLAQMGDLRPGERVLDVAAGTGDSAMLLAREFGVTVHGVDLSPQLVALASAGPAAGERVTFTVGDAERLAVADGSVDAVLCECALCMFPNKGSAVSGFVRVLAPGGRLLLSDVVVDRARLPRELASFIGRVACLADALPLDRYLRLLESCGFRVCGLEHHADAVLRMGREVDARLAFLAAAGVEVDLSMARALVRSAIRAAEDGIVGYVAITAEIDEGFAA
jgi:hypothetical protein